MPRILVLTDTPETGAETLLSEHVDPIHLESRHAGDQLLERLAWAVRDAQRAERTAARRAPSHRRPAAPPSRYGSDGTRARDLRERRSELVSE